MNRTWLRWQTKIHSWLYQTTNGRIGSQFGSPVLLLTTMGRKSGKSRTNPLYYLNDGKNWAVVASNAGSDKHPAWWLNLLSNPQASIQIKNQIYQVTGRIATEKERVALWSQFVAMFAGYDDYQKQSTRKIPVIILVANKSS